MQYLIRLGMAVVASLLIGACGHVSSGGEPMQTEQIGSTAKEKDETVQKAGPTASSSAQDMSRSRQSEKEAETAASVPETVDSVESDKVDDKKIHYVGGWSWEGRRGKLDLTKVGDTLKVRMVNTDGSVKTGLLQRTSDDIFTSSKGGKLVIEKMTPTQFVGDFTYKHRDGKYYTLRWQGSAAG